jgi:uncharacterized repeat protein (TIGR03803 family)
MTKLATLTLMGLVIALISFTEVGWAAAPGQKVLYAFQEGGTDGIEPEGGLIFDASGNLYGTTTAGGGTGGGTVFELTPTSGGWKETVLYSFQGGVDGVYPTSSLAMDSAGNLYGTTLYGGTGGCVITGCGTVFELMPPVNGGAWTESIIYSFQNGADGAFPESAVIVDNFGNLFGTTSEGGNLNACGSGCGTVFELSLVSGNWTQTTLYTFEGGTQDGAGPISGLTLDRDGNLYGATSGGGIGGLGTIYELSLSNGNWSEKILYAFPGHIGGPGLQGRNPSSTLVFDSKGELFGTADGGNANGCCGVVFVLRPGSGGHWTESVYRFTTKNGAASSGTLVFDASGNLYGTSPSSGQFQLGTAYRLKQGPKGSVTETYYSFCPRSGCPGGALPKSGLILDGSGKLYGTTWAGGVGWGTVYEITP